VEFALSCIVVDSEGFFLQKKLMLILNPAAGKGRGPDCLAPVSRIFYRGGYIPSVFYSSGSGSVTQLVLEYAKEFDCVVCVGGDGTLSETVSGLAQLSDPPVLGYIPQGTANDVAATLHLPRNPVAAAEAILTGKPYPLDVGRFNLSDYFTYIAAFGAFTEVSYETPREVKQTFGQLGYILTAMSHLPSVTDYAVRIETDDELIDDRLIFGSVSNSTSVAGVLKLTENEVSLDDGLFEVLLIQTPSNLSELNSIISNVMSRTFSGSKVKLLRSKKIKFTFDRPVKWTRDGEQGGAHDAVLLENIHTPLRIMK
jgi:YegS/Rv2252/BmrU family lipid kinase